MAIAKHEALVNRNDVWAQLSAPLPQGVISWRQDGRPVTRDGKFFARFVAYIEANTVRERLDSVVPGEWDTSLELLPPGANDDGEVTVAFKARLSILGVHREDVGHGKDYKQAATDAFKRAAVRFGIGHELYSYEQNWVQVDGDGKYAKPVEDPADAYARRMARAPKDRTVDTPQLGNGGKTSVSPSPTSSTSSTSSASTDVPLSADEPSCPKCGGRMWDNRLSKKNPKAPDYKCRSRSCDGVVWPPKPGESPRRQKTDDEAVADMQSDDLEPLPF